MVNLKLTEISFEHQDSFLEMIADYQSGDPATYEYLYGHLQKPSTRWEAKQFQLFVKQCTLSRMDWRPKAKKTSVTHYILLDDDKICANGQMQFPLNEELEIDGGNLRFDVPPSMRGRGFATLVLNAMLFEAARAGLARALVTCEAELPAAIHAIERNRGEFADSVISPKTSRKIQRYWIKLR